MVKAQEGQGKHCGCVKNIGIGFDLAKGDLVECDSGGQYCCCRCGNAAARVIRLALKAAVVAAALATTTVVCYDAYLVYLGNKKK